MMNFATWTLFFTVLIGASCKPDDKTCPSFEGSRYLPIPGKIEIHKTSVCGELFSNSSCCSEETIGHIENMESHIFDLHKVITEPVSQECETALMHYACLYECSPNLGRLKNITSPLKDVPVCKSSCEWLYNKCKTDVTCTDDWGKAFDGTDFKCQNLDENLPPFEKDNILQEFKTAEKFCYMIRNAGVFKLRTSNDDCFNVKTGEYIEKINQKPEVTAYNIFSYLGLTVIAIVIVLAMFYAGSYAMKRHRLAHGI